MKSQVKFLRKDRTIAYLKTDDDGHSKVDYTTSCRSINEAKRKSRELQLNEDGALGRGSLRVVGKIPQ